MLTVEWKKVRFQDGNNVNLLAIREAIQNEADRNGIPVAFREEQIKVGSLFNKQLEDILVMYNPEHANDYLKFVVRVQHRGAYAFMYVYNMGGSKNFRNSQLAKEGGVIGKISGKIAGVQSKLQAEEQYYQILSDVIENVIG